MVRQTTESPVGDVAMLDLYARGTQERGYPSVCGWFNWMYNDRANIAARRTEMANEFLKGVTELRKQFDTEPGFARNARKQIKQALRPRATLALLRAIIYQLCRDRRVNLTVNDALDLTHCVVPAAYCDFVLLDRAWYGRLNDARSFLTRSRIGTRVAQQFTQRDSGVTRFLDRLERWEPPENPAS
jgi:hypothetical protein